MKNYEQEYYDLMEIIQQNISPEVLDILEQIEEMERIIPVVQDMDDIKIIHE